MKDITPRELLMDAIKGISPGYSVFDHPLIKKAGNYTGGFHDKWSWNDLTQFSEAELKEIYLYCKNSI